MKKSILSFLIILGVFCSLFSITGSAYAPSNFTVNAQYCMLSNMDTGEILYSKNADERLYPASITKLMTALVVCENVDDLNQTVTIDGDLLESLLGTDSSLSYIVKDEVLSIDQLLHYLLITSGNDTALVLAKYVGGTVDRFIEMMNETAAKLGMNSTHFDNPHGLPDDNHYTTVNDIHKLATAAFAVEKIKTICGYSRYQMPATNLHGERTLSTTNFLIDKTTTYFYKYCTGGKTGYTESAGRCIVSTAEKEGMHYLSIVMNADPKYIDANGNRRRIEFTDTARLFEWAFNNFSYKTVIDENEYLGDIDVGLSWEDSNIQLFAGESLTALLPNEADKSSIEVDLKFIDGKKVDAPIEKGETIAVANVYYANEPIGTIELCAGKRVNRSALQYIWMLFIGSFDTIWFKLIFVVLGVTLLIYWIICVVQINSINRKRRNARRHR
ncbi:MAG: D-alanyl-D-alanine carboxypeptidase [Clostridia bacterium]|nr:D-alanyl-D-alanine carboxypeptidase [Clostridia bacterium]